MNKSHLRLVIDNAGKSSGLRPPRSARMRRSWRKDHGHQSLYFQVETLPGLISSLMSSDRPPATAFGPPNKKIKSSILRMMEDDITFCEVKQVAKCTDAQFLPFSQNVIMAKRQSAIDEKRELATRTAERVRALELLYRELRPSCTREEFAAKMGLSYGAYKNALDRGGFRMPNLIKLAKSLDVSMDYICGLTDSIEPLSPRLPEPTLWEAKKNVS